MKPLRVIIYSGPHYGKVHVSVLTNRITRQVMAVHQPSGDVVVVPWCDVEEIVEPDTSGVAPIRGVADVAQLGAAGTILDGHQMNHLAVG